MKSRTGRSSLAPASWPVLGQSLSRASGFGGTVSDLRVSSPENTAAPFRLSYQYLRKQYSGWPSSHQISLPLPPILFEAGTKQPSRPTPLGALGVTDYRATVQLPPGYTATAPAPVNLDSDFAAYQAVYSVHDGVMKVERRLTVKRNHVPVAEWASYRKFSRAVLADEDAEIAVKALAAVPAAPDAALLQQAGKPYDLREYGVAAPLLEQAVQLAPGDVQAWQELSVADMGLRRFDGAAVAFRKQIQLKPDNFPAETGLAMALTAEGKSAAAIADLRQQIIAHPDDNAAHAALGSVLFGLGRYAQALPELETGVASVNNPGLALELGQCFLETGQPAAAIAWLQRGAARRSDPATLSHVADLLAIQGGRLDLARQYATRAIAGLDQMLQRPALAPASLALVSYLAEAWDALGWTDVQQNQLAPAAGLLAAAWSTSGNSIAGLHLGELYQKQGRVPQAELVLADAAASGGGSEVP